MIPFNQYVSENEYKEAIVNLYFIIENENILNESKEVLIEAFSDNLSKFGLKAHKSMGLIDYIGKFSKGAGKLIIAAAKGDKAKVKEIATSMDKTDILDFLYKLDLATFHIVTGPLHFIDAVTGWDISVAVKEKVGQAENIYNKLKKIFIDLKDTAKKIFTKQPEKIKAIDDLQQNLVPE